MNSQKTIHIVGAGFSGLSLACLLSEQKNFRIVIFEKSENVGGLIQSKKTSHGLVETGANSIIETEVVKKFLKQMNISTISPKLTAKARYFYRKKMTRWPLNLLETLHFLLKLLFHVSTLKFFLKTSTHQTLENWATKKFTTAFGKYILSPAFQGIYSLPGQYLNADLILNETLSGKKNTSKGIVTCSAGMQDIINKMADYLKSQDVHFQLNTRFSFDSQTADYTVICTSAADAASLVKNHDPEVYKLLKVISMNNLLTVTCFVEKQDRLRGFGCLIPENSGIDCLGVLFNSDSFDERVSTNNQVSETYIFGGIKADITNKLSQNDLMSSIQKIRKELFSSQQKIISIHKTHWENGLPIYNNNMFEFQNAYKKYQNKEIYLHGNYTAGIGLSKILSQSIKLAQKIKKDIQ